MSESYPSVYCYQFGEGAQNPEHKLYLGQFSTLDGLQLLAFSNATPVEVSAAWFDDSESESQSQERIRSAKTMEELTIALAQTWSLCDFTCEIKSADQFVKLSTHDDAECHFILESEEACRNLVLKTCAEENAVQLWRKMIASLGSYVCFDESEETLSVFSDFNAYLKSLE